MSEDKDQNEITTDDSDVEIIPFRTPKKYVESKEDSSEESNEDNQSEEIHSEEDQSSSEKEDFDFNLIQTNEQNEESNSNEEIEEEAKEEGGLEEKQNTNGEIKKYRDSEVMTVKVLKDVQRARENNEKVDVDFILNQIHKTINSYKKVNKKEHEFENKRIKKHLKIGDHKKEISRIKNKGGLKRQPKFIKSGKHLDRSEKD